MRRSLRPATLRGRVAAAAAVAIVLATSLLGIAAYTLVARELATSRDDALRQGAVQVAQLDASAPALLTAPGALEGRVGERRLLVEVVDRRGRIVARSGSLGGRVLALGAPTARVIASGRPALLGTRLGDDDLRVFIAPLAALGAGPAAGGAVLVATSTSADAETLRHLRGLVLASAALAALLAAAASLWLTRRALRPLARLSTAASEIERTGDAARRLPSPGTHDELGELAGTLNGMLASLERARDAERRFVADASHELRTPLTALRGNAAYVARHGGDAAVLADLEADAARLARLLDDLLALAREDAASRPTDDVRLDELVREAAAARPNVTVDAPRAVSVRGDRAALARALENLLANAERYGPPGGAIVVSATSDDGRALLEVLDEGAGLDPEAGAHAFERFWRGGDAARPAGSGLGLAIVRATAERHGGRVRVDGSRFTIDLPAS